MKYLIQIKSDDEKGTLEYHRAFESDDLSLPIRTIDDALSKKPRAKRSDAGSSKNTKASRQEAQ